MKPSLTDLFLFELNNNNKTMVEKRTLVINNIKFV